MCSLSSVYSCVQMPRRCVDYQYGPHTFSLTWTEMDNCSVIRVDFRAGDINNRCCLWVYVFHLTLGVYSENCSQPLKGLKLENETDEALPVRWGGHGLPRDPHKPSVTCSIRPYSVLHRKTHVLVAADAEQSVLLLHIERQCCVYASVS